MSDPKDMEKEGITPYEDVIREKGSLLFTPGGTSMMPLLSHHGNPVLLVPPSGRLKKGDVPFYKRANGQYVLHRVMRVRKDSYDMCGDNQVILEKGVTDSMIFAVMDGFYKDGEYISVNTPWVRRYARRRIASRIPRRIALALKRRIKRLFKKG